MNNNYIKLGLVVFELTDACNQSCKFCYNYWKTEANHFIPPADFEHANNVLKQLLRQAHIDTILFSGGEPMMVPNITDLVMKARFANTQVNILTNGTLFKNFDIENLNNLGVQKIQIPLLSWNAKTHDELTQMPGSWEKALAAIKRIASINADKLNVVIILSKPNFGELEKTLAFYDSLGVKTVLVNRFNIGGNGLNFRDELELSHLELNSAFKIIDQFSENHKMDFFSGVCMPICVLNPADFLHVHFTFCYTHDMLRPITVNYLGDVLFRNYSPKILGNIFSKSISEILNSKENQVYYR